MPIKIDNTNLARSKIRKRSSLNLMIFYCFAAHSTSVLVLLTQSIWNVASGGAPEVNTG